MKKLSQPQAQLYIPDGADAPEALARTTHLAIGAHQDDLEIIAYDGIAACHGRQDAWFCGVVVTDGAGSPRSGPFADCTDTDMQRIRAEEQKRAADLGQYGAQFLLHHPSRVVKEPGQETVAGELRAILEATRPHTLYTHNPFDKHDTHVAVMLRLLEALRGAPPEAQPKNIYGCEVWRDLDWLPDDDKVALDCSGNEDLQRALLAVFESQTVGGKRYDEAVLGRRRAHATFHASHSVDAATGLSFAVDLKPLVDDDTLDPAEFARAQLDRFADDVLDRIRRFA